MIDIHTNTLNKHKSAEKLTESKFNLLSQRKSIGCTQTNGVLENHSIGQKSQAVIPIDYNGGILGAQKNFSVDFAMSNYEQSAQKQVEFPGAAYRANLFEVAPSNKFRLRLG